MKTTFLLSLPRCGSLALSVMMNNKMCVAHHEGNDYESMMYGATDWVKTYAANAELYAATSKKNYFCCDTSSAMQLLASRLAVRSNTCQIQVLYIHTSVERCIDSYERIGIEISKQPIINHVSRMEMTYALAKKTGIECLAISKENYGDKMDGSLFFSPSQLIEIASFIGAYDPGDVIERKRLESLRTAHMSMSNTRLINIIEQHEKTMIPQFP